MKNYQSHFSRIKVLIFLTGVMPFLTQSSFAAGQSKCDQNQRKAALVEYFGKISDISFAQGVYLRSSGSTMMSIEQNSRHNDTGARVRADVAGFKSSENELKEKVVLSISAARNLLENKDNCLDKDIIEVADKLLNSISTSILLTPMKPIQIK